MYFLKFLTRFDDPNQTSTKTKRDLFAYEYRCTFLIIASGYGFFGNLGVGPLPLPYGLSVQLVPFTISGSESIVRSEETSFTEHTNSFHPGCVATTWDGRMSHISGQFSNIFWSCGDDGERFRQYWWTPNGASEYRVSEEKLASSSNVAGLSLLGNSS